MITRQRGWTCFFVNQLACPGIGTMMAGRRVLGMLQVVVMLIGVCGALAFLLMYLNAVYKFAIDGSITEAKFNAMRPPKWLGVGGFALCVVAWLWSLFSSFRILNESRRHQPL